MAQGPELCVSIFMPLFGFVTLTLAFVSFISWALSSLIFPQHMCTLTWSVQHPQNLPSWLLIMSLCCLELCKLTGRTVPHGLCRDVRLAVFPVSNAFVALWFHKKRKFWFAPLIFLWIDQCRWLSSSLTWSSALHHWPKASKVSFHNLWSRVHCCWTIVSQTLFAEHQATQWYD